MPAKIPVPARTPSTVAPSAAPAPSPESAVPRGCTALKLRQLTRRASQHYDQHLGAAGLKTTQYSLLSAIDKLGPLRPGELADRMEMDPSTLTRNLQPLVAAGWVETGAGDDSRSRRVAITPAGRTKRAEAQRAWKRAQLALNERLGTARVAALHALLDDCLERMTQARQAGTGESDE